MKISGLKLNFLSSLSISLKEMMHQQTRGKITPATYKKKCNHQIGGGQILVHFDDEACEWRMDSFFLLSSDFLPS